MKRGLGLRAHGSPAAQVAGLVIALTGVVNSTVLLVVGLGVHDVAIMGPSPPRRA